MPDTDIAAAVRDVIDTSRASFETAVAEDAEVIKDEIADGAFDNPQGLVGLEYEFYAATAGAERAAETDDPASGALRRIPRRLLAYIGFEKELGLHNAEITTTPQPLNEHGLAAQQAEVRARLAAARGPVRDNEMRLVSDGLWVLPPEGQTARAYLTDTVEDGGVTVAANMSDDARYHAMGNSETPVGGRVEVPHVSLQADTAMPESLTTSIQPHYQVPRAAALPSYFRYALRLAGPLLALGVNSPFLPPDCYDDVAPTAALDDAWLESRIEVFESVLNADGVRKARFPTDVETVEAAVDRVVEDPTVVPMSTERGSRFDDRFAAFRQKHGTFWRWVRPVFGGASRSRANVRIEFRPLPGQPTVRDSIALQAAFAGALEGLHASEHPVGGLEWATARDNFYAATRDGLDASLEWVTDDGRETTDTATMYDELFDYATRGLRSRGLSDEQIDRYLAPLRHRVRTGMTPAAWKHRHVADRVEAGASLAEGIAHAQRRYLDEQATTLLTGAFADWDPAPDTAGSA